jgi:glucose/arabinose dehydrogenase
MTSTIWALLFAAAIGCGKPPPGKGAGEVVHSSDSSVKFKVETVASGLEVPWSIVFLPDGRTLVSERPGRIRVIENGTLRQQPYLTIADVEPSGESGLMGMALHPGFAGNHFIYVAYAYRGSSQQVRVVRYRETGTTLAEPRTIIEGIPAAQNHAGCRMAFGPDGKLYITTGDATDREQAQQLNTLGGKTLRMNDDGSVPHDNPFVGRAGARPEIWSYGHRNSQGIAFQPGSGLMFQTEHGPSGNDGPGGGDEVNIVERGKNYGWPVIHHTATREGMESPLLEYTPAVAPGGASFYTGSMFPELAGNFLFACLRGECIIRVVLDGRRVVRQERLFENTYGRIRDLVVAPDGSIWFCTSNQDGRGTPASNDDRILRLVPGA